MHLDFRAVDSWCARGRGPCGQSCSQRRQSGTTRQGKSPLRIVLDPKWVKRHPSLFRADFFFQLPTPQHLLRSCPDYLSLQTSCLCLWRHWSISLLTIAMKTSFAVKYAFLEYLCCLPNLPLFGSILSKNAMPSSFVVCPIRQGCGRCCLDSGPLLKPSAPDFNFCHEI